MASVCDSSIFRQMFLQKLRLTTEQHTHMPVLEDSTLDKGPAPHEPDMNHIVDVQPEQSSQMGQQIPDTKLADLKSSVESDQSGDESVESDHPICIEVFPNEILEKILSSLSGISFLRYLILFHIGCYRECFIQFP